MSNQNILEEKSGMRPADKSNEAVSNDLPASKNTNADGGPTSEDQELRKKVDARTEYLNSIKLLLS